MKHGFLLYLCLIFNFYPLMAEPVDSAFIQQLGLPILSIHTIDNAIPTCDFVWAPEGEYGISTINKTKIPGRIILSLHDSILYDSGNYQKDKGGMTIRIRGNTSAYYSYKKPYKIKLEKKADLLCRHNEKYNDKNWLLLDQGGDNLKWTIGFKLNDILNLGGWTPNYMYVNLFFNGDYHGIYMLVESVKKNADCRINVDNNSGFIIERDAYWWNEPIYFKSTTDREYTFKYPEEPTTEQIETICNIINDVETSIETGQYNENIDIPSFAKWLLAQDILGNKDGGGTNIFMTKYDMKSDSKITMSTLWDFDSSFRTSNEWAQIHNNHSFFYYPSFFNSPDNTFVLCYKQLWREKGDSIIQSLIDYIEDFGHSQLAHHLQQSRKYDGEKWNYPPDSVQQNINEAIEWFTARKEWIDENIETINDNTIIEINTYSKHHNNQLYDLTGHVVTKPKKGIYIRNGRKVIIK